MHSVPNAGSSCHAQTGSRTRNLLGVAILLGSVDEEIANTLGVTPLVVVPGDELNEVVVELDTGRGVEDGGGRVADEVSGDDRVLGVVDDALVGAGGGLLHGGLDVVVRSGLLETSDKVNDGNVVGGNTEGETTKRCDQRDSTRIL